MLGSCRLHQRLHSFGQVSDVEIAEAVRLARVAIEVGRDDPDALWMAGWTLSGFTSEHATAENVIDRALTLNPSSAHAWIARGLVSVVQDRPDQAIEALERAIRLSPLDRWGRAFTSPLAMAHFAAGRYEEAIQWADRALAAQPDYRPALRIKAVCCAYLDRIEEARNWLGRVLDVEPGLTLTRLKALMPRFSPKLLARFVEGLRKAGLPDD
jgi:tetratricopeptide (TPR) repeat protein